MVVSFFYGEFSHAIRKVPKQSDYRVQEEHGGTILPAKPSFIDLNLARTIYDTVEAHLAEPTLFHRVDLVRNPWGHLEIMEIELIEPSLYFRTDPNSVTNFVTALEKFLSI